MTSSAKPNEASPAARRPLVPPDLVALAVLCAAGWGLIAHVNRWHLGAPALFLMFGWLGVLLTGRYLWNAADIAGREGEGGDDGFAGRSPREELVAEKRALLKAIKEVEFDVELGKMSRADADDIIRLYRARAIEILKELEDETGAPLTPEQRVERELAARLQLTRTGARKPAAAGAAAEPAPDSDADSDKAAAP